MKRDNFQMAKNTPWNQSVTHYSNNITISTYSKLESMIYEGFFLSCGFTVS